MFNYVLVDNNIGGLYIMMLKVRILSDIFILDMIFVINFGNKWISVEMDFFVVNGMKVWMIMIMI